MDITACIGTYGDQSWADKAIVAAVSAIAAGLKVSHVHGETLHEARNAAFMAADTDWVCGLDADDVLDINYLADMDHGGDLRAPKLAIYHKDDTIEIPNLAIRDIETLNPCCIGTVLRKELFEQVGGFPDYPIYEDWGLYRKCVQLGATITHHNSYYCAPATPDGRNLGMSPKQRQIWYHHIQRDIPL